MYLFFFFFFSLPPTYLCFLWLRVKQVKSTVHKGFLTEDLKKKKKRMKMTHDNCLRILRYLSQTKFCQEAWREKKKKIKFV